MDEFDWNQQNQKEDPSKAIVTFSNLPPLPFQLKSDWRVALAEIFCRTSNKNITSIDQRFAQYFLKMKAKSFIKRNVFWNDVCRLVSSHIGMFVHVFARGKLFNQFIASLL